MNYDEIIRRYKGSFVKLDLRGRSKLLKLLFVDLKQSGFSRKDFTEEISNQMASLLSEGTTMPETIKQNLKPYIREMINADSMILDGHLDGVTEEKEEVNQPSHDKDENLRELIKPSWDVEYMKRLGMEHPDE